MGANMGEHGITFADFISGPGGRTCQKLGLEPMSWTNLVDIASRAPDLVDRARAFDGKASSGERVVLHAVLAASDFAWLADELSSGKTWGRIGFLDLPHRLAVAAVAARLP